MTGKAVGDFELGQGTKNEHRHSYLRLFVMRGQAKKHTGLPVDLGLI